VGSPSRPSSEAETGVRRRRLPWSPRTRRKLSDFQEHDGPQHCSNQFPHGLPRGRLAAPSSSALLRTEGSRASDRVTAPVRRSHPASDERDHFDSVPKDLTWCSPPILRTTDPGIGHSVYTGQDGEPYAGGNPRVNSVDTSKWTMFVLGTLGVWDFSWRHLPVSLLSISLT
jgi:hypothetical protein